MAAPVEEEDPLLGRVIDGRYRTQVKHQVDLGAFTPVDWPEMQPAPWLRQHLTAGRVGFDPWLHTPARQRRSPPPSQARAEGAHGEVVVERLGTVRPEQLAFVALAQDGAVGRTTVEAHTAELAHVAEEQPPWPLDGPAADV